MHTSAPTATILIRLMVGGIFLSEGIQKFLYPEQLGAGRFERIGIPAPELMGPLVAGAEVFFGILILLGLFTRLGAIAVLVIMAVALFTTKIPILLGQDFTGFHVRELSRYGLTSMLHESRNDLCMVFGSMFLLLQGAGRCSLDAMLARKPRTSANSTPA